MLLFPRRAWERGAYCTVYTVHPVSNDAPRAGSPADFLHLRRAPGRIHFIPGTLVTVAMRTALGRVLRIRQDPGEKILAAVLTACKT